MKYLKIVSFMFVMTILVAAGPVQNDYDVVVIGSDPEGISAAVSASREGSNVLLVDKRQNLGGLYTSGMLSMLDMNYKKSNSMEVVNEGFFREFYDRTANNTSIDIEHTKKYFANLLANNNVETMLNIYDYEPILENDTVTGVTIGKNNNNYEVNSKVVIDASQDAQFARKAGSPYIVGREDLGMKDEYAASTLVFSVKGVDWHKVTKHLTTDGSIYTGANEGVAWGYEEMLNYSSPSPRIQLRRLNLSKQNDGSVVINALQIFGVDSISKTSQNKGYYLAISELPDIVSFLRNNAPGFENAQLHRIADELYIREGVRIVGEDTLTSEDVFNNKDFSNKIAYGSYPTDLQATKRDSLGGTILTGRNLYTIPFGVMIPKGLNQLLVVGRSASYDSISHSSARTVPVGIALGQAAGVASNYSVNNNINFKTIKESDNHINVVQHKLRQLGVTLDTELSTNHPEKDIWAYPYMQNLRSQGLLSKEHNYVNDYYSNEVASNNTFERIIDLIKHNSNLPIGDIVYNPEFSNEISLTGTLNIANQILNTEHTNFHQVNQEGIIDDVVALHLTGSSKVTNAHIYALMDNIVAYIREENDMPIPSIDEIIRYDDMQDDVK